MLVDECAQLSWPVIRKSELTRLKTISVQNCMLVVKYAQFFPNRPDFGETIGPILARVGVNSFFFQYQIPFQLLFFSIPQSIPIPFVFG